MNFVGQNMKRQTAVEVTTLQRKWEMYSKFFITMVHCKLYVYECMCIFVYVCTYERKPKYLTTGEWFNKFGDNLRIQCYVVSIIFKNFTDMEICS